MGIRSLGIHNVPVHEYPTNIYNLIIVGDSIRSLGLLAVYIGQVEVLYYDDVLYRKWPNMASFYRNWLFLAKITQTSKTQFPFTALASATVI